MLKKIKEWMFGPSYKFTAKFYMKSGAVLNVPCDNIKVNKTAAGEVESYNIDGAMSGRAFAISLINVEAIQYFEYKRGD